MLNILKRKLPDNDAVYQQAMDSCELYLTEMGAELHDDLIQKLSVFRLHIDRIDNAKTDPKEIESIIVNMNAEFQEVVLSVRRISRRLLPARMTGESFQKTLEALCQSLERPGGGTIHFIPSGHEQKLSSTAEIHIFRIVQELVHNSIKHSSAWHVWVKVTWAENSITICVEDDGTAALTDQSFIEILRKKNNTLRMRTSLLKASLDYAVSRKGLAATVVYGF